jgi:hypothetical protein
MIHAVNPLANIPFCGIVKGPISAYLEEI